MKMAFVCVENAGRSQIAEAVTKEIIKEKELSDIEVISGGTEPAENIHPVVKEVLEEENLLKQDMEPTKFSFKDIDDDCVVITMGCTVKDKCPVTFEGETVDWDINDPKNKSKEEVIEIKEIIEEKIRDFLEKRMKEDYIFR